MPHSCFCEAKYVWEGYEGGGLYPELGATGLPKCFDHPYCFCNGGERGEGCDHCERIRRKRKFGHKIFISNTVDFAKVNRILANPLRDFSYVWPGSQFVKEYVRMKTTALTSTACAKMSDDENLLPPPPAVQEAAPPPPQRQEVLDRVNNQVRFDFPSEVIDISSDSDQELKPGEKARGKPEVIEIVDSDTDLEGSEKAQETNSGKEPEDDIWRAYPNHAIFTQPPESTLRDNFYRRWWEGLKVEGICNNCTSDTTVMRPLENFSTGIFLKACMACGHREEVTEQGFVPYEKNAMTQTTPADFQAVEGRERLLGVRNTANLKAPWSKIIPTDY